MKQRRARMRTTTILLAAIAVLLGLNLWHSTARAQPQVTVPERVVGIATWSTEEKLFRVWSDGLVEWRACRPHDPYWYAGSEWAEVPDQPYGLALPSPPCHLQPLGQRRGGSSYVAQRNRPPRALDCAAGTLSNAPQLTSPAWAGLVLLPLVWDTGTVQGVN